MTRKEFSRLKIGDIVYFNWTKCTSPFYFMACCGFSRRILSKECMLIVDKVLDDCIVQIVYCDGVIDNGWLLTDMDKDYRDALSKTK